MSGEAIEVVRHPRARRAKLSLDPATGRVRLTLPPRAPLKSAMAWAEGQTAWIAAQRAKLPQPRPFVPDIKIPLYGRDVTLVWRQAAPRKPLLDGDLLICGGPREAFAARVALWLRREALRVLAAETAEYAAKAGVSVSRVSVADAKARWGSCSSSGAIRYSWRLILAPEHVRRATVAHEVAHRLHMDHSPRFYAALREIYGGDPEPARAWLRTHGAVLHWFGKGS